MKNREGLCGGGELDIHRPLTKGTRGCVEEDHSGNGQGFGILEGRAADHAQG